VLQEGAHLRLGPFAPRIPPGIERQDLAAELAERVNRSEELRRPGRKGRDRPELYGLVRSTPPSQILVRREEPLDRELRRPSPCHPAITVCKLEVRACR
jgi:hypothetical protein